MTVQINTTVMRANVDELAAAYKGEGEAMAMGERTPLALLDAAASARMAIGEALTNLAAAAIDRLAAVKLSANWMAAAGHPGEDARLFDAVQAVGLELCPALGISIPVGKDSMSMKTVWQHDGAVREMTAPLSLIISAFAPVRDVRRTLTPQLRTDLGDTDLVLVDLGEGNNRLGATALAMGADAAPPVRADLPPPTADAIDRVEPHVLEDLRAAAPGRRTPDVLRTTLPSISRYGPISWSAWRNGKPVPMSARSMCAWPLTRMRRPSSCAPWPRDAVNSSWRIGS